MNLAEALPKEIERVQALMEKFKEMETSKYVTTMKHTVNRAVKAFAEGDIGQMVISYKFLQEYES